MFSSPPGTEMFQFSGCPPRILWIQMRVPCIAWRVSPFGCLRVTGRLRLTGASRRLLRPSSAPCPKASTVRPYLLDFHQTVDHIEGVHTRLWHGCPHHVPVKLSVFPVTLLYAVVKRQTRVLNTQASLIPNVEGCSASSFSERDQQVNPKPENQCARMHMEN